MKKLVNPFIIEGYVDAHYFCDREEETAMLLEALASGRNVTMISPRRMGKSGLIQHAFNRLRAENAEVKCFYIDLFHTQSLADFINVFASSIFGTLDTTIEKLYHKVINVFKRARPVIMPDAITGVPSITLNMDTGQEQYTLKEIFEYLKESGQRIYVAFDEFQQIAEYEEKGVEALLRSFIQFTPNVSFVFAGSKKHMMQEMFTLPSRPFYQSTQTMSLSTIPYDKYYEFARGLFQEGGKSIDENAFRIIYDTVEGHTWYVQYWLSRLYDYTTNAGEKEANDILTQILKEEDDNFYTYSKLLSKAQLSVMIAIAKAGVLAPPITQALISQYNLPAPSTVRSCINKLLEKEMLLEDRTGYTVYNRFFRLWLARNN